MSGPAVTIASVVEGEGEVRALPKLLYRLAREAGVASLRAPAPMRVPRGKLTAPGGIERAMSAAALRVGAAGGVLVVLDADDDCPATLGPELLARARAARPDVRACVVLANREFEAWFIAAAASLAGAHGFPEDLPALASWFTRLGDAISQLPESRSERLVLVQRALIDLIDLFDPGRDRFESGRDRFPRPRSPG